MIERIRKEISHSRPFEHFAALCKNVKPGYPVHIRGISGSLMAFVAAELFEKWNSQVVLIAPEAGQAEQLRDDCSLLVGEGNVRLFTRGVERQVQLLDMTAPIAQMETLQALSGGVAPLIVTSAEAIAARIPPPEQFLQRTFELDKGKQHPFEDLLHRLTDLGFERKDFVEEYGDFAVRGGILDIFPYIGENPVRIEFWGDAVESIREFDALSQRSIRELETARIVANMSVTADSPDRGATVFDYLQDDAVLLLDEPALIQKEIEELLSEGAQSMSTWNDVEQSLQKFGRIIHSNLAGTHSADLVDFASFPQPLFGGSIKRLLVQVERLTSDGFTTYLACDTREEADRLEELIEEELTAPNSRPITVDAEGSHQHTRGPGENLEGRSSSTVQFEMDNSTSEIVNPKSAIQYTLLTEAIHSGFIYPPAKLALFTEHGIFGRLKRRGLARKPRFKGFSVKEVQQLRRGDFVVHQDYGIGKFAGLQKIRLRGIEQEVMKVFYHDDDILYVNLDYVNRVQKYASQEGHIPKLSKLGAADWERLKSRARRKIKDIARDLIKLYARRKHEQGFAFSPDTHWQKEMEASFMYEDTPDQSKATFDVKRDMELLSPMDRLICGDVGFGKTEVAVRAAFKAVLDGKQATVLVPTTILAQQHYNTFLDRLGRYAVRIDSLTRFRSKKEQNTILENLRHGKVDILIGTHRILSKDVAFKNLGLLVIDEEQRFGVSAKEKLRQLRATVDTLTLTATPIPRTLHFSLMGARDLSIINTPPRNRLPIITEIAEFDQRLIREAILKEIHRGGQVYFVHDRIQTMDAVRVMLEKNIPEAKFHIAHGQMPGHELEKTMMNFLEKKHDALICTKIIESGIDIPSVNTIIINRADRFGLAELYQLRGRVGRSNEQAYAYLITPPLSSLPRASLRRLQAIQEFTELGSGFNLAMRDLEIRGAGNLLGAEQSGFIFEMGFETYQRIVQESVAELKEEEFQELFGREIAEGRREKAETVVETDIEALIPDFYIESDSERLDVYRRLYKLENVGELQSIRAELRDRFGEYPEEVEHLLKMIELKLLASTVGFIRVELTKNLISLTFPPGEQKEFYESINDSLAPFQKIMNTAGMLSKLQPRLKQEGKELRLSARGGGNPAPLARLEEAVEFISILAEGAMP